MKKNFFIATVVTLFMVSCAKVSTTPDFPQNPSSQVNQINNPPLPVMPLRYEIINTETDNGLVEYRLEYTDPNGVTHNIALGKGERLTLCLSNSVIKANFAYQMKIIGTC
jgi:hypothetical protein